MIGTILTLEYGAAYDPNGTTCDIVLSGTVTYGVVVTVANGKLMFSTHAHTFWSFIIIMGSIASFFLMW